MYVPKSICIAILVHHQHVAHVDAITYGSCGTINQPFWTNKYYMATNMTIVRGFSANIFIIKFTGLWFLFCVGDFVLLPHHSQNIPPPQKKTSDHWHQVLNVINQKRFFSTCLNHKTNSWWRIAVWMVFYFNFLPSVSIHFVRVYLVKIACKPWEIKAMWSQKNRKKKKNNF